MAFRYEMTAAGVESVQRVERGAVAPGPGQIQIRMRTSSLNYHDYVTLIGLIPNQHYPRVPLSDSCGEIAAVGEIDAASVVQVPTNLNDVQAATLPCAGLTAWYALIEEGRLQPGQTVLVQGSGGVSLFALQLAKAVGAHVVATSSSDEKLAKMKALGADYLVNYREHPDWEKQIQRLTGGVDSTIDIGGQSSRGRSAACVKTNGFIAVVGVLGGFENASVSIFDIMQKNLTIKGVTVGCGGSFDRMCRFIEEHDIKPHISDRITSAALAEGLELMQSGKHFGKISVIID